jgi:archaellum component FlaC
MKTSTVQRGETWVHNQAEKAIRYYEQKRQEVIDKEAEKMWKISQNRGFFSRILFNEHKTIEDLKKELNYYHYHGRMHINELKKLAASTDNKLPASHLMNLSLYLSELLEGVPDDFV